MLLRHLLAMIVLATAGVALAATPIAAADTCASATLENTVCTPVNATYCALYAGKEVAACELRVVANCIEACPDDLPLDAAGGEVDLRWLTSCPGPWGHEERTRVGPVTIVTYHCDGGDT